MFSQPFVAPRSAIRSYGRPNSRYCCSVMMVAGAALQREEDAVGAGIDDVAHVRRQGSRRWWRALHG